MAKHKKNTGGQVFQGDLCLIPVKALPKNAKAQPSVGSGGAARHVLAYGELTGHAHSVLADRSALYVTDDEKQEMYLVISELVGEDTYLEHGTLVAPENRDHAAIKLAPGVYKAGRQQEYREGRNVMMSD